MDVNPNLAKYLVKIINDAMRSTYLLNLTGSITNQISSLDVKPSYILPSYDVVSSMKNIPLNETMDIFCNYIYQQHSQSTYSMKT